LHSNFLFLSNFIDHLSPTSSNIRP